MMMLTAPPSSTQEKRAEGFGRMVSALGSTLAACFSSLGLSPYGPAVSKKTFGVSSGATSTGALAAQPRAGGIKAKPALQKLYQRVRSAMVAGIMPKLCSECRTKVDRALATGTGGALCPSCRHALASTPSHHGTDTRTGSLYESLTRPWCRYCGTTESRTWRHGPWGPRTLCEEHASAHAAGLLDLSSFRNAAATQPVVRSFCGTCWIGEDNKKTSLLGCSGCPLAYHRACVPRGNAFTEHGRWYCSAECRENCRAKRVGRVRLPDAKLPYERAIDITGHTDDEADDKENAPQPKAKRALLPHISVPPYRTKLLALADGESGSPEHDDVSTEGMQWRHAKYEAAEKKSRLLRPSVLSALTAASREKKRPRAKSCE